VGLVTSMAKDNSDDMSLYSELGTGGWASFPLSSSSFQLETIFGPSEPPGRQHVSLVHSGPQRQATWKPCRGVIFCTITEAENNSVGF
jgi:hypothetical protein